LAANPTVANVTCDRDGAIMASFTPSRAFPTTLVFDDEGTIRSETRGYIQGQARERSAIAALISPPVP
jgi:hypothetical protein